MLWTKRDSKLFICSVISISTSWLLAISHLLTCIDVIISSAVFLLQNCVKMQRVACIFNDKFCIFQVVCCSCNYLGASRSPCINQLLKGPQKSIFPLSTRTPSSTFPCLLCLQNVSPKWNGSITPGILMWCQSTSNLQWRRQSKQLESVTVTFLYKKIQSEEHNWGVRF